MSSAQLPTSSESPFFLFPNPLELRGHAWGLATIIWHPNGSIASSGLDETVRVWDTWSRQGRQFDPPFGATASSLAWRDPEHLGLVAKSGKVRVVHVTNGRRLLDHVLEKRLTWGAVAWSSDGSRIATGGQGNVCIWELERHRQLEKYLLTDPEKSVSVLAWAPDGTRIAAVQDDLLEVWDVQPGNSPHLLKPIGQRVTQIAWSPKGSFLAIAYLLPSTEGSEEAKKTTFGSLIEICDASTGLTLATYRGHQDEQVSAIAWSPNETFLASGGFDQYVHLWPFRMGEIENAEAQLYQGHRSTIAVLAFSPDGTRLASGALEQDSPILVWAVGEA